MALTPSSKLHGPELLVKIESLPSASDELLERSKYERDTQVERPKKIVLRVKRLVSMGKVGHWMLHREAPMDEPTTNLVQV